MMRVYLQAAALSLLYIGAMLLLHRGFDADLTISGYFFKTPCLSSSVRECWMINKEDRTLTFLLHDLPVDIFKGAAAIAVMLLLAGYFRESIKKYRYATLVFLLAIAVFPGLVSLLKGLTGHYCPAQLSVYGGPVGAGLTTMKPRCFPAGFPSPGFGLIILYFSDLPALWRRAGLFVGLGLGTAMSIIQLARGEHFLTHNIATLLTAVFIGCLLGLSMKYIAVRRRADTHS